MSSMPRLLTVIGHVRMFLQRSLHKKLIKKAKSSLLEPTGQQKVLGSGAIRLQEPLYEKTFGYKSVVGQQVVKPPAVNLQHS